jgi:hypothetical protein
VKDVQNVVPTVRFKREVEVFQGGAIGELVLEFGGRSWLFPYQVVQDTHSIYLDAPAELKIASPAWSTCDHFALIHKEIDERYDLDGYGLEECRGWDDVPEVLRDQVQHVFHPEDFG